MNNNDQDRHINGDPSNYSEEGPSLFAVEITVARLVVILIAGFGWACAVVYFN